MMRCGCATRSHVTSSAASAALACARYGSSGGLFGPTACLYAPSARLAAAAASRALGITKSSSKSSSQARRSRPMATAAGASMVRVVDKTPSKVLTPPLGGSALADEDPLVDTMADGDEPAFDMFDTSAHDDAGLALDEEADLPDTRRAKKKTGRAAKDAALARHALLKKAPAHDEVRSSSSLLSASPSLLAQTAASLLNPFKGLHAHLSRSYRLDQLTSVAAPNDVLLARQEKKSTAFSFLRFASGPSFYQDHWASVPALVDEYARHDLFRAQAQLATSSTSAARRRQAPAVPGYTLFNNNLGLNDMRVQSQFPLLVAQRLLLFPDSFRHFHALCGRENVPCDFYADIDLPEAQSAADGEKILLEVLNYLEVRLPGVGFTDPFFMVLANEQMQSGRSRKIGYHVHARSMTFAKERQALSLSDTTKFLKEKHQDDDDGAAMAGDRALNEEEDDLSDLVNIVDGAGSSSSTSKAKKNGSAAHRLIAFQDYRTVKLLADEVNQTIGHTIIDEGCYRANGMLRCAFSAKLKSAHDGGADASPAGASQGGLLLPLVHAKDTALQAKLTAMEEVLRTMTDAEILEMSFCTRHLDTVETAKKVHQHLVSVLPPARSLSKPDRLAQEDVLKSATAHRFRLVRPRHVLGPQSAQAVEYDMYGNIVSAFLTEGAKWRRYKSVITKLNDLPPTCATSYDIWVRIGLALHNFSNEDHVFEEWVKFSLRCPQKYSRESCRRKWVQFERNPDAQNWRRGFNYLNSTIWRQI